MGDVFLWSLTVNVHVGGHHFHINTCKWRFNNYTRRAQCFKLHNDIIFNMIYVQLDHCILFTHTRTTTLSVSKSRLLLVNLPNREIPCQTSAFDQICSLCKVVNNFPSVNKQFQCGKINQYGFNGKRPDEHSVPQQEND